MSPKTRPVKGLPLILILLLVFLQPAVAQRQWVTAVISGKTVSWIWTPIPVGPAPTTRRSPSPTTTPQVTSRPTSRTPEVSTPTTTTPRRTSSPVTSSPSPTTTPASNPDSSSSFISSSSRDPTADGASQTDTPSSSSSGGSGLSTGAIAGLAVGMSILGIAIIAGIIFFLLSRRSKKKLDSSAASLTGGGAGPEMAAPTNFSSFREEWPELAAPAREPTLPALGSVTDLPSQSGVSSEAPKVPLVFSRDSNDFDSPSHVGSGPMGSANNSPWAPRVARGASPVPGSYGQYSRFKVARRPVPGSSPPT